MRRFDREKKRKKGECVSQRATGEEKKVAERNNAVGVDVATLSFARCDRQALVIEGHVDVTGPTKL